MHDLAHRTALALLFAGGLATLASSAIRGAAASPELLHHQYMLALLGMGLLLSLWRERWRLPMIAAGLLVEAATLPFGLAPEVELAAMAALATAGAILLREARMEARWDGVLGWRPEV